MAISPRPAQAHSASPAAPRRRLSGDLNINSGTVALAKSGGATAVASTNINVGDGTGAAGSAVLRLDASNQIIDCTNFTVKAYGNFNLNGYSEGL